jgi:hypothetical protein
MFTIVYITCRDDCRIEWFLDSIQQQNKEKQYIFQLVIVDSILDTPMEDERRVSIKGLIGNRFDYIHVSPKPTQWQGPHKITSRDYFCAANTRNTGACYAKYDYICFIDDLGIPVPTWLDQVYHGYQTQRIYCGAYTKATHMVVTDGKLVSFNTTPGDIDSRLAYYNTDIAKCYPSHMFGSSFCMPIEVFLTVNGINEDCDSCGGEDYEFGIRLDRHGHNLYYNKLMFIYESNDISEIDREDPKIRIDPEVSIPLFSSKLKEKSIVLPHAITNRPDYSHFLIYCAQHGLTKVNPTFSLSKYRQEILSGNTNPFILPSPDAKHLFTDIPLREM